MTREYFLDTTKHLGKLLRHFDRLESTNDLARESTLDPKNQGLVIVADFQTQGRGQYGRVWQAPPESSLLMSVLVFPPSEICRPILLTALAAVSVCELLEGLGSSSRIKWPNDVLVSGKKICGILIECSHQPRSSVVIGIGLNLNQSIKDFEKLNLPDATSLGILLQRRFSVLDTARGLISRLDDWYDQLLSGKQSDLERIWCERIGLIGQQVRVTLHPDRDCIGLIRELSFEGIVLETINGTIETHPPELIRQVSAYEELR